MPLSIHVSGGATLSLDGSTLGYSVDGIEISPQVLREYVFSDFMGPMAPTDIQYMGEIVTVKAELVKCDTAVLANALGSFSGVSEGGFGSPGKLYFAQSGCHSLSITPSGGTGERSYSFNKAFLDNAASWKVGVRRTVWMVEFTCYAVDPGTSIYS